MDAGAPIHRADSSQPASARRAWKTVSVAALLLATLALPASAGEDGDFFDPGLFADGDVQVINGRVVVQQPGGKKEEAPAPDPAGDQVLELTDGSQLHGRLVALTRGEVVWKRADATDDLIFTPQEVRRVVLGKVVSPKASKSNATLKLAGTDWVTGNLLEMRDDKFVIQLGAESPVEIPRAKVDWLVLAPSSPPDAYEGPIGPMGQAGWESGGDGGASWDYADGALVAKNATGILRQFEVLPEKVDIQFTAGDGGSSNRGLTLWMQPGTRTRGYGKGSSYLRFQSNTVNANYSSGEQMKNFNANIPEEKDDKKITRYRLLCDRKEGRLVIFVNGKQIADWDLPANIDAPEGGNFSWQPSYWSSNMAWTLSNVRVAPWDGLVPADRTEPESGKDVLSIAGQPRKAGKLTAVTAEGIAFDGTEIARKESLFLRLHHDGEPEPPGSAIARVWLADRGEFDVTGIGYRDGKLRVRTSFGGDLTLPSVAVRAIEFPHRLGVVDKAAAVGGDILVFKNGDQLRGTLLGADHKKPLRWKPIKGESPVEFSTDPIAGILLAPRRTAPSGAPAKVDGLSSAIRLSNGDWLPGKLQGLDATELRMRSNFGLDLRIGRPALRSLYLGSTGGEAPVWDGASDRDAWQRGTNAPGYWGEAANRTRKGDKKQGPWRYLDGAFTLLSGSANRGSNTGPSLGRNLEALPEKVEVGFTISSTSGPASYSVQLFFDENKAGFMVQGGWDSAYLYDMSPRKNGGVFFNQPQQIEFGEKIGIGGNSRHFRFLGDRKAGRVWMFVNGHFVGAINRRNAPENPKGKGIAIIAQPMMSRVTVSNLWVAPWSGFLPPSVATNSQTADKAPKAGGAGIQLRRADLPVEADAPAPKTRPETPPKEAPPSTPPTDTVALTNGDEASGNVVAANSDTVTMKSDVGDLEIPLKRATLIDFAGPAANEGKGIRLRFSGKGSLTVSELHIENDEVVCRSDATGELRFPIAELSEIVYQPQFARTP